VQGICPLSQINSKSSSESSDPLPACFDPWLRGLQATSGSLSLPTLPWRQLAI